MKCNVRLDKGSVLIDETNFSKHYGAAINVFYKILGDKIIVTGEYLQYKYNDYNSVVDMDDVDESEIITHTPWWSSRPRKKVREGYVRLKKTERFKFISNNYIIKKKLNEHNTNNE